MAFDRAKKGAVLGGQEIFELADVLAGLRAMRQFLSSRKADYARLWALAEHFPDEPKIETRVFDAIEPDGEIRDNASAELHSIRRKKASALSRITERIQSYLSGKSREYLSDPLYTVRDGRYVIPVKSEHRGKIKGIIHDTSGSGQTVFVEPEDVLQLGNAVRELEGLEREEIQRILTDLSALVGSVGTEAILGITNAGELDFILARARLAFEMKALAPTRGPAASIKIEGGRHPMLDPETGVPLDLEVGRSFYGLLITGPNTGGKTVAIKCIGLFVLMAQCGLFLPARAVELGVFSQVWADIGDEQSISQSLSTFSAHIKNIAAALNGLKPNSLALFDEIGAGTDPAEGAALAKALLRAFVEGGARVVASTHYGELKAYAYSERGFQNAAMEFDSKSLRPTYRVLIGAPGASHALKIAERYGLPSALIEQAKVAQGEQNRDIADMLERLEQAQKQARTAQGLADKRAAALKQAEEIANRKLAEADEIRRTVHAKATSAIEETLREIRLQAEDIFDELRKGSIDEKALVRAKENLKAIQSLGEESAEQFRPQKQAESTPASMRKGARVRIDGYSQIGVVLEEPKGTQIHVQLGALKMTVSLAKATLVPEERTAAVKPKGVSTIQKASTAVTEISVRGMRAADALERVERFIDEALLGGLHQVRIIHGKGEGILRKLIQDMLRRNISVGAIRDGDATEGGMGATIVQFK